MFVGGTIGEAGKLQLDAEPKGIPIEDLVPHLTELVLNRFGGVLKEEYAAEHKEFLATLDPEQAKQLQAA